MGATSETGGRQESGSKAGISKMGADYFMARAKRHVDADGPGRAQIDTLEEENSNERVVHALYEALSSGDVETVQRLLAPDIEWWFHGPPSFQYLMRLLTGEASSEPLEFVFEPQTIAAFGSTVLVEGYDLKPNEDVFWVHAWTVADGVITQVREYFNTSLTVTRLDSTPPNPIPPSSASSSTASALHSLWESRLYSGTGKSMPGLVLAI